MTATGAASGLEPARGISVDVDGTLYRVRRLRVLWRLRWERGLLLAAMAAREKLRSGSPAEDRTGLLRQQAELVAPSFGWSIEHAMDRLDALGALLPEALTRGILPFGGVRSALEGAVAKGLKIAVFSDWDPEEKLRWLGLDDLPWQAQVSAERSGALKPHRRAFDQVAEALALPPGDIVHVGDREDIDVRGALDAGMRAWRFSPRGGLPTAAEHEFGRWSVGVFGPLAG
jgi:putative hydrolase of the HAD superfamily